MMAEVLLASKARAGAAMVRIGEAQAWPQVVSRAGVWRVVPQLSERVTSMEAELPCPEAFPLRRAAIEAFGKSAFRMAKGVEAIRALERCGIRVAAFKGLAAIAILYGSPRRRSLGDADLIISEDQLGAALACLAAAGFERRSGESFAQYVRFVENAPGFAGNRAVALHGPGDSEIDLHWELGSSGLTNPELLDRAVPVVLGGATVPVVHPVDAFLLSAHHTVRDNFSVESSVRDLADLQLLCPLVAAAGGDLELARRAGSAGLLAPVIAVTKILEEFDPREAVCAVAATVRQAATRGQLRAAKGLSEAFRYQLESGSLNRDLLYLVHPQPFRQILTGMWRDRAGYRESRQAVEETLGRDHSLAHRAASLARALGTWRGLRVARGLARAKFGSSL